VHIKRDLTETKQTRLLILHDLNKMQQEYNFYLFIYLSLLLLGFFFPGRGVALKG